MLKSEDKIILLNIKKEIVTYLENKGLDIYMHGNYPNFYVEHIKNEKRNNQEKFYSSLSYNKLALFFSSERFDSEKEHINIFVHLYKNTNINKNYLLTNINDLTDGNWKKKLNKFLTILTDNLEERKDILLNASNTILGLNSKNLKQVKDVVRELSTEEKIQFWVKFFTKRKKFLTGNKGGTDLQNFLTENFSRQEIKENFINISPYVKDLFEMKDEINIFKKTDEYQKLLEFEGGLVEKILTIPGFNKKKIDFEIPKMMIWLSSIMGYNHQVITQKTNKIQFLISSNEVLNEQLFTKVVNDYLGYVKENNGKLIENEENFSKWYMKNKLENKLLEKDIKYKPLKI